MPRDVLRTRSWNSGEIDPDLLGRDDVKVTENGALRIENFLCLPQGPLTRRPGLPDVDIVRHQLAAVDAGAATWTTPNGGTAADGKLVDGTPVVTTTDLGVTDGYVVLEIDFGAPVTVHLVDVVDFGLQAMAGGGGGPPVTPPVVPPIGYPWGALDIHFNQAGYFNSL